MVFNGKTSRGLEAERTPQYVSISDRGTTQPLDARYIFEIGSGLPVVLNMVNGNQESDR